MTKRKPTAAAVSTKVKTMATAIDVPSMTDLVSELESEP